MIRRFLLAERLAPQACNGSSWLIYLLMAATALGVVARLHAYVYGRALWRDEGMVAMNVINRGFVDLVAPLDYGQLAPVGFLFSLKLATILFGEGERALRLFPLLAGLAALPLMFLVARAIDGWRTAWFATALVAVAPSALYFSTEAKQYAYDILLSLMALWLGLRVLRSELSWWTAPATALFGALMIWFSHPVALVLGGIGLTLISQALAAKRWNRAWALIAIATVWFVSFVAWVVATGSTGRMLGDEDQWAARGFLALPPRSLDDLASWARVLLTLPALTLQEGKSELQLILRMMMLVAVVWVAGLAVLWRRDRWVFAMVLSPFALALLLSMLEIYPIIARLVVFLLPLLAVPVAMLLSWATLWPDNFRVPGMALALGFLVLPLMHTTLAAVRPFPREELPVVLNYVVAHYQPGDVVWLYPSARLTFHYYERSLAPQTWREVQIYEDSGRDPHAQWSELRQLVGQPRVWCVFYHVTPPTEEALLTFMLDDVGERLDSFHAAGASVYLYDLSKARTRGSQASDSLADSSEGALAFWHRKGL